MLGAQFSFHVGIKSQVSECTLTTFFYKHYTIYVACVVCQCTAWLQCHKVSQSVIVFHSYKEAAAMWLYIMNSWFDVVHYSMRKCLVYIPEW